MSLAQRPPMAPGGREPFPDDPDRLLRTFFRAEMPVPWPAWQPPAVPAGPPRRSLLRSRLALAASLLFLISGPLALSGIFSDSPSSAAGGSADKLEATGRGLRSGTRLRLSPTRENVPEAGPQQSRQSGLVSGR